MPFTATINGTPEKNIFRGMIADYDLQTGLCELVDNALDLWVENDRPANLKIDIILDSTRQFISVEDNAGGVEEKSLRLLIAPGASRSTSHNLIGIFGVGGKRAGVALGEIVEISTRYKNLDTYKIRIDNDWLEDESWDISYNKIKNIKESSTIVEISRLRQPFSQQNIDNIRQHLAETYSWFIKEGCEISLNGNLITAISFDIWSYPPEYSPRSVKFDIKPDGNKNLAVEMHAGLIGDRDPEGENYGVYIYCNNRLIIKEMRVRDVGYFISAEAGVPHPDASLCRVIVWLEGSPELMPWNSSKSNVNIAHPSFQKLQSTVISLVSWYTKLSRRLKSDWEKDVFHYTSGSMEEVGAEELSSGNRLILPKLPRGRKLSYLEDIRQKNSSQMNRMDWTIGLIDAIAMVDIIIHQKIETKNRAALILLDSNFEISLKEFIVHREDLFPKNVYTDSKLKGLFNQRTSVIREVSQKVPKLTTEMTTKAQYYYGLRNKLIHERTTIPVSDREIADYRKLIEKVLNILFGLKFPKAASN